MIEKKHLTILSLLIIVLLYNSCSVRRQHTLFNTTYDQVADTIKQVYVVNDRAGNDNIYKIRVNDQLTIRNLQNPEFGAVGTAGSTSSTLTYNNTDGKATNGIVYLVEADGKVNLPAIGKVEVLGLTRREAADKIQEIYKAKLLKDPIIELAVVNLKVTLLGEFNKQGNFLLSNDHTSLVDIIGEAGGITKTADPKTLKIIRGDRKSPEIIYVNLTDINSLASNKLILQNNDILVLQPTKNSALSERLQSYNNIVQPLLVVINVALLIFTVSR